MTSWGGVAPILVPRGCTPFGQHGESRPLDRSSEILILIGFANTMEWDWNQSDLSDLTLSDGKAVNRGLPVLEMNRGHNSWCWPKGAWPLGTRIQRVTPYIDYIGISAPKSMVFKPLLFWNRVLTLVGNFGLVRPWTKVCVTWICLHNSYICCFL